MCRPGTSSTVDTGCSAIGVFFSCSSLLPTPSDRWAELWSEDMDEDGEEMLRMTMMINSVTPIDGSVDVPVDKGHCSPVRTPTRPSHSARDPHGILVDKFSAHDHERRPGTAEKDEIDNDNHDGYTAATTKQHSAHMVMCSPPYSVRRVRDHTIYHCNI
ncbi:uncharacterized protein LOC123428926 [Hordeum vulgare subsp. vulgare]|uniref:uncharacterized protein LOC123428926 n=1 Tax=Hordeum vulgare subsp. vulgare TaxID=112509 RepID=UPI001D1A4BE0|nr:uncharacterized protein LOC123428926 [Hordeum vulgare subsp. vulgare]